MASSLEKRNSRFVQGGTTDTTTFKGLGFWQRKIFPKDHSDVSIILEAKYDRSPWKLAFDVYNDVTLQWFILQYNNILDPEVEFIAGKQIMLPTPNRLRVGLLSQT